MCRRMSTRQLGLSAPDCWRKASPLVNAAMSGRPSSGGLSRWSSRWSRWVVASSTRELRVYCQMLRASFPRRLGRSSATRLLAAVRNHGRSMTVKSRLPGGPTPADPKCPRPVQSPVGTHRVGNARPGTAADPALATRLLREVGDRGDLGSPQLVAKRPEHGIAPGRLTTDQDAGFTSARREPPWCGSR
jgi:hypothetical protein